MPARADADGIIRTEPRMSPIEPNGGGPVPPPAVSDMQGDVGVEYGTAPGHTQETSASWHQWFRACLEYEMFCGAMGGGLMRAVGQLIDERAGALELKLAEMRGAVDVLRGRGWP
jgi:hypothetical protein